VRGAGFRGLTSLLSSNTTLCVCGCYLCRSSTGQYLAENRGSLWSGELSKHAAGFGYSEKQVTIAVDSAGSASTSKTDVKPVKEVPLWLSHSTVDNTDFTDRQLQQLQVIAATFS